MTAVRIVSQQQEPSRYRGPARAAALCMVIAAGILVAVVAVTQPLNVAPTGPYLVFAALWAWAGYRLQRHDRGALAVGLSWVSVIVLIANVALVVFILSPLSGGATVRSTASGLIQLLVPAVGAIGVLLALRRYR